MGRNVSIMSDSKGRRLVVIHDVRFKGKRRIDWKDVEKYLKQYVGGFYEIGYEKDIIYIGNDLPDEYSGSEDTARLKGTLAKAKANAVQGIPELIEIAMNKRHQENFALKHNIDAKYGWYRYTSRFALPVYAESEKAERYNVFVVEMLIRCAADGKLYLYDVVNIKKETSTPLEQ